MQRILDATGQPLADSAGPDRADDTYVGRPEVASALAGNSVQGTRHSDTLDEDLLYTAVPCSTRARRSARRG